MGTTFRLFLPRAHAEGVALEESQQTEIAAKGDETILLVEDNPDVRTMLTAPLEQLGYKVITTNNGKQGLTTFTEHQQDIALVISDVIMPVMGGVDMSHKIRAIQPKQPILFITGYAFESGIQDLVNASHCQHIQKPFAIHAIAEAIRSLLE